VRQGEGRESHKGGRYGGAHQEAIAHTQVDDVEEQHAEGYQETGQQDPSVVQLHAQPHEYFVHHYVVLDNADQSLSFEHGEAKNGGHGQDACQAKCSIAQSGNIRLEEVTNDGITLLHRDTETQDEEQKVHNTGDEGKLGCLHLLSGIEVQFKWSQSQERNKCQGSQGLKHIVRLRKALPQLKGH